MQSLILGSAGCGLLLLLGKFLLEGFSLYLHIVHNLLLFGHLFLQLCVVADRGSCRRPFLGSALPESFNLFLELSNHFVLR